jgi:protein-S-isoprenylcysteine O-methyltransferase Ste14
MAEGADNPGVIAFPPLILLIAVVVAVALEFLVPISFFPAPGFGSWLSWLGALLFIGGLGLSVMGSREFRKSGTNVDPRRPALKVVDTCPYRFTRNPMYLGMTVALAGLVLGFSLEWGVPVWIAFVATLHYGVIRREERYMAAKFGKPYEDLVRRTRRWI